MEEIMNIELPLENMTTAEKLQTMEALWESLCLKSDELPSPSWHADLIAEREKKVEEGKEKILDWSAAKNNIRRSLNEN